MAESLLARMIFKVSIGCRDNHLRFRRFFKKLGKILFEESRDDK